MQDQIRSSYFIVYYLKPLIDNMVTLMNCTLGEQENVEYSISPELKQEVKNCYYMRNRFFFYFCEKYCEHYQLTSPTELFDGNLKELKKVIEYMNPRINKVFEYPQNNILTDGIDYELSILQMNWELVFLESVFFKPVQQEHLLDT